MMEDISGRIKMVRKKNKLNQQEFAKIIGLSQTHISKIESGKGKPSDKTLRIIAVEFGVNFDWLKSGQGNMEDISYHKGRDTKLKDCTLLLKKYLQSCSEVEFLFCAKHVFEIPSLFQCSSFMPHYGLNGNDVAALLELDTMLTVLTEYVHYMNNEVETVLSSGKSETEKDIQERLSEVNDIKERYQVKMLKAMEDYFSCFVVSKNA